MDQWKRSMDRGRCEHATFPVEVLPVGAGKKIAHCLECGRSGPVRQSSVEALVALRGTPRLAPSGSTPVAWELAVDGKR